MKHKTTKSIAGGRYHTMASKLEILLYSAVLSRHVLTSVTSGTRNDLPTRGTTMKATTPASVSCADVAYPAVSARLDAIEQRLRNIEQILGIVGESSSEIANIHGRISAVAFATNVFSDEFTNKFSEDYINDLLNDYSFVKSDFVLTVNEDAEDDEKTTHVMRIIKSLDELPKFQKGLTSSDVAKICNVSSRHALRIMSDVVKKYPDRYILHQVRLNPRSKRTRWVLEIKDAAGVVA